MRLSTPNLQEPFGHVAFYDCHLFHICLLCLIVTALAADICRPCFSDFGRLKSLGEMI